MKFSLLTVCTLSLLMTCSSVKGDALQDEIDQARNKFCGGIQLTAPEQGQVFTDPTKVTVTVTRVPNAEAKIINGVDIYSIDASGQVKYLGTPWRGSYALSQKATLTVDITKTLGVVLPSQFEFRVWVHNTAGPDCTLMSKVFKATAATHSNEQTKALNTLDENIDRGCFGLDISKPALGDHVKAVSGAVVQIDRDPASHVQNYKILELHKINLTTRQSSKVEDVWVGNEVVHRMFNIKADLSNVPVEETKNTAYFYKLTADTQHDEQCFFNSHPFYIDGGA
ncbi:hypothetical protein BDF14DRAFT_1729090 [Spinellus fusiger]|nr:hypothetical protein BDF14DRAFT_1729090 [Spinellus fusiger]